MNNQVHQNRIPQDSPDKKMLIKLIRQVNSLDKTVSGLRTRVSELEKKNG